MAKLKSAWEIALEKTESIVVDAEKIKLGALIEEIKKKAGKYISGDKEDPSILEELKKYGKKDLMEALKPLLVSNLSLPQHEIVDDSYIRLENLSEVVLPTEGAMELYSKLLVFLKQYPLHKKELIDGIKKQLEPMLKQKEEAMSRQMGYDVHLSVEEDKECLEIIKQNLEKLDKQYGDTLTDAKKQLEDALIEA